MPGRQRRNEPQQQHDDAGMCPEHFSGGWPNIQPEFATVACEHGQWDRPADDGQDDPGTGAETPPEP